MKKVILQYLIDQYKTTVYKEACCNFAKKYLTDEEYEKFLIEIKDK